MTYKEILDWLYANLDKTIDTVRDRNMTDNDMIKALKSCHEYSDCDGCLYGKFRTRHGLCVDILHKDCVALIKCQKAEIEGLQGSTKDIFMKAITHMNNIEDKIKSEAIKEFAERLKTYAKELHIGDNISWLVLGVGRVDNLVKEMTEVQE